jgi:DNA polymerase III subunit epsilon
MRQIVIDTETTGLDPGQDHRVIEIAALEIVDRRTTGRTFCCRLDPERNVDTGATDVHGLTWDDLKGLPKFKDVAAEFLDFARGAEWIIHNAPFDVAFLDYELRKAGVCACADIYQRLTDTLALAREMFPGKRNSLDALCERFDVGNSHRTLHGARLDAELLADVYLAMTRGQETLSIEITAPGPLAVAAGATSFVASGAALIVVAPTELELATHHEYLAALDRESRGRCLWLALLTPERVAA